MTVPVPADERNYYIYNQYGDNPMHPVGPIGLIMHHVDNELSDSVNYFLRNRRSIYVGRHPELALNPGSCVPTTGFQSRHPAFLPVKARRLSLSPSVAMISLSSVIFSITPPDIPAGQAQ
jgi:hypothetical protein